MAADLAGPHRLRDEAQDARQVAASASHDAEMARRAVQRAEQRALTAERRAAKLAEQVKTSRAEATRARMARDQAQSLLQRKIGYAKDAQRLRNDPDALIALVADQNKLLDWYRRRVRELGFELRAAKTGLGNR